MHAINACHNCRITTANHIFYDWCRSTLAMVMLHKHIQRTVFANHISYDGPALQFQGLKSQTQNGTETLSDHLGWWAPAPICFTPLMAWSLWVAMLAFLQTMNAFLQPCSIPTICIRSIVRSTACLVDRSATQSGHATQRGPSIYPHSYGQLRLWTVRPLSRGERLRDRRVGGARTGDGELSESDRRRGEGPRPRALPREDEEVRSRPRGEGAAGSAGLARPLRRAGATWR